VEKRIFLAFCLFALVLVPLNCAFAAQMASESYRMTTSCFSSSGGEMVSLNFASQGILGQSSPIMDSSDSPAVSLNFSLESGFIYTLDAVLECESLEGFANAYGTTSADSRYNPACESDFDGDIDGIDLSGFIENF